MALSEKANAVKKRLGAAVSLRQTLDAIQREWSELADSEGCLGEELIWQLLLEKRAVRRQFAALSLRNWIALRRAMLNERRFRLMRLRYVEGESWASIVHTLGKSKQYLMREHNRALEQIAKAEEGQ